MPSYGVRFYKAELFVGLKRTPIAFEDTDEQTRRIRRRYGDHPRAVLDRFTEQQVRGFPRPPDAAEETAEEIRKKTLVIFNEVRPLGSAGIRAEFRVGRSDDHDRSYPAPDLEETEFVNLVGYSPTRPYRAALLLPDKSEVGMLRSKPLAGLVHTNSSLKCPCGSRTSHDRASPHR